MMTFPFLKSVCVLCDAQVIGAVSLCEGCREDLPHVGFACRICALPLENNVNTDVCGQCISQKSYVDYAVNLFHYVTPVDYLISQMKFQRKLAETAVLASLFEDFIVANEFEHGLPELILPMPLHKKRLAKRGFNQSLEIAKPLAKNLGIPIALDLVTRVKDTQKQTHLNKKQRRANVAGCFALIAKPSVSHIVIVDDVVTTGATTNELARLLKKEGVEKVGVWSLARAELH